LQGFTGRLTGCAGAVMGRTIKFREAARLELLPLGKTSFFMSLLHFLVEICSSKPVPGINI
jgi:hypothetical protein